MNFNSAHSSQRIIVENSLGQLKGRFRVAGKQVDIETCKVDDIVIACCTPYNFRLQEKEIFLDEWWPTDDEDKQEDESAVLNDNWGFDADTTQDLFLQYLQ